MTAIRGQLARSQAAEERGLLAPLAPALVVGDASKGEGANSRGVERKTTGVSGGIGAQSLLSVTLYLLS